MENGQILAVVGPTAVGKTKKAMEIARAEISSGKWMGVDLISVDSRQVYRGLEILTGADLPDGFGRLTLNPTKLAGKQVQSNAQTHVESDAQVPFKCFANADQSIRLFGVSIIKPSDEWSVAHFRVMARQIIARSFFEKRKVILVGGTGLYYRHLFDESLSLFVPPNPQLRHDLEKLRVDQLRARLIELDPNKFISLNQSDRANKRRLIRAIELISLWKEEDETPFNPDCIGTQGDMLFLTAPLAEIEDKIKQRVAERFASGAVSEVQRLIDLRLPSSAPVLSTLGVPEISTYLQKKMTTQECLALWALHEYQYAKRQLTWWKKY